MADDKLNHFENAKNASAVSMDYAPFPDVREDAQMSLVHSQIAIAEALTGILELLTGVIGDRGSVVDVRVQGSVSTGDQR